MAKTSAKGPTRGIKLGSVVMDRITGFKGIAMCRTQFVFGCVHITIQAQQLSPDGSPIGMESFDDQRIEVLSGPTQQWPEPGKFPVELGDVVRDSITGATGTATARATRLDGGVHIMVEQNGVTAGGEPKPPVLMFAGRVKVIKRGELRISASSTATSGGPMARVPKIA